MDRRWVVLLIWSIPFVLWGLHFHTPHKDWLFVEIGARTLVRHHLDMASGPALHLYVTDPEVQMGPPSLLLVGPFQWLPEQLGGHLAAGLLSLLVLPCLWCLERAAVAAGAGGRDLARRSLLAGLVIVPVWTYEAEAWGHVDDVVGLFAMSVTCLLVSRGRHEVLAGLVLGTGAAAKPWVVLLLPLLLAYPRPRVPRALLAFVIGALVWWLPFVLADPGTVHALGSLRLAMKNEPTWVLLGIHGGPAPGWIRPAQLLLGICLSTIVVRRVGWTAVPLIALAWRVTSDPYDWPYYVMGPLLGAALWDLQRRRGRWWSLVPWATVAALLGDLLVERAVPAAAPALRLVWFVGLTGHVLLRAHRNEPAAVSPEPPSALFERREAEDGRLATHPEPHGGRLPAEPDGLVRMDSGLWRGRPMPQER